jgi:hypothetical protein
MLMVAGGLLTSAVGAAAGAADDPMATLVELREALQAETAWVVEFDQEYIPAGFDDGDRVTGRLWLAWPDRMLFVSGDPPVQWLGLEGRWTRLIDLDAGTCEDHRLTDEEWERIPLVVVLDPQRAVELFTITSSPDGAVVLLPAQRSDLERVQLRVDAAGLPLELEVHDGQGSINRFDFGTWSPASSDVAWIPEPPEDVSCFGE